MIFPVFIVLYVLAHVFIWHALVSGLDPSRYVQGFLAVGLATMALTPFLARRLERRGLVRLARIFAWVGYTWAGLVLLFVMARFAADLVLNCALLLGFVPTSGPRSWFLDSTGVLTALLATYAFIERSRVRIETIDVPTHKDLGGRAVLRVAQISDVHIGSMNGRRRVRALLERLERCKADIVVSTGDLIDSRAGLDVPVTELLAGLRPPLGKFAILGNHECYAGLDSSLAFMERSGFVVIRNDALPLPGFHLIGMDDPVAGRPEDLAHREYQLLRSIPKDDFAILLKHRPDVLPSSRGRFDLQLSGHTHKGQIFPFGFLTRLYYPAHAGLFRLARTCYLYVSRGTGAWGPPFRLGSPPEITLFSIGPGRPDPGGQLVFQRDESMPEPAPVLTVTVCSERRS